MPPLIVIKISFIYPKYKYIYSYVDLWEDGRRCHVTQCDCIHWSIPRTCCSLFLPMVQFCPLNIKYYLHPLSQQSSYHQETVYVFVRCILATLAIAFRSRLHCVGFFRITFWNNGVTSPSAFTARYRIRSERDRDSSVPATRCNRHPSFGTAFTYVGVRFSGAAATTAAPSAPQPDGKRVRFDGHVVGSGSV